jgi:hypothetical protein
LDSHHNLPLSVKAPLAIPRHRVAARVDASRPMVTE